MERAVQTRTRLIRLVAEAASRTWATVGCETAAAASNPLVEQGGLRKRLALLTEEAQMFYLPLTAIAVLASISLVHGQGPGSQEVLSQHRDEWLRSLDDAPIIVPENFRRSAASEIEDFEWKIPTTQRVSACRTLWDSSRTCSQL